MAFRPSSHPRITRMLLALAVPPLLIELLLQMGAVAVSLGVTVGAAGDSSDLGAQAGKAACAALCVGDSFTYGLGSSDPAHSYPMQLEVAFKQRPFHARSSVVNAGWPGHTSRDVLLTLKSRFETLDPACVIVLVGVNDMWRMPERLSAGDLELAAASGSPDGFRLEWRTRRLIQLLLQPRSEIAPLALPPEGSLAAPEEPVAPAEIAPATGSKPDGEPDPLIGRWRGEDGDVIVLADGTADLAGVAYRWSRKGRSVEFMAAGPSGKVTRSQVTIKDRGVSFRPYPGTTKVRHLARVVAAERGQEELKAAKDPGQALARLDEEILRDPTDTRARLKRIGVARLAGAKEVAEADVAFFERVAAESRSVDSRHDLAMAFNWAGRTEEAGVVARELLAVSEGAATGSDAALWLLVARADVTRGDVDRALVALDRSLAIPKDDGPFDRPDRLRFRARLHGKSGATQQAVRDAVEAWSIDGQDNRLARDIILSPNRYTEELLTSAVESLGLSASKRERLVTIVKESIGGSMNGPMGVLADHVKLALELCRQQDVPVFLLNYPTTHAAEGEHEEVAETHLLVAEQTGARLIDVRGHFRRLMQSHRREEYFIADGHCNDAGYAEMARIIANAIAGGDAASGD
ncbi:MAG: hypothetical protein EXS13_00110 [Planctomycetes bacterium]|nr:hypothetical protein [Planctomycetota bacterium]